MTSPLIMYNVIAHLPGTPNLAVVRSDGAVGYLDEEQAFHHMGNAFIQAACSKYGYKRLPSALTISDVDVTDVQAKLSRL